MKTISMEFDEYTKDMENAKWFSRTDCASEIYLFLTSKDHKGKYLETILTSHRFEEFKKIREKILEEIK